MHKLSEQEKAIAFAQIFNLNFCGAMIRDQAGVIIAANPQFYEITGLSPSEIIDVKLSTLLLPEYRESEIINHELLRAGKISSYPSREVFSLGKEKTMSIIRIEGGIFPQDGIEEKQDKQMSYSISLIAKDLNAKSLSLKSLKDAVVIWISENKKLLGIIASILAGIITNLYTKQ